MGAIEEGIRCRIFSYNKHQGKSKKEPVFVDEEREVQQALSRLTEKLIELALEGTDF